MDGKDDDEDTEGLKAKCFTPACDIYVPIYRKKYYAFVPVTNGVHTCPGNMLQSISTNFNFWPKPKKTFLYKFQCLYINLLSCIKITEVCTKL